jgi:hypothetical protein
MVAYTYRMPAGIPGEVTRFDTYGATISPEQVNASAAAAGAALNPPSWAYGALVIVDASGARPIVAGDTAYAPAYDFGFLVRPFPGGDRGVAFPSGTVGFGAGTPPVSGVIDVLRRGYLSVKLGGAAAAAKGGAVYYYAASSTGLHVQGASMEAAAGGNLVQVTNAFFQGPADANGNTEIGFNI